MNVRLKCPLEGDPLALVLDGMLPFGGHVLIECQTFFDESCSHEGSPNLCVAGLIFKKGEAIKLGREWRKVLEWKGLPYFHMVDCAHGNPPFDKLSKEDRSDIARRMIEIIKRRAVQALAVTISNSDFDAVTADYPRLRIYKTPYALCSHSILSGVRIWLRRNPRVSKMAYIFEQGHRAAPQTMKIMDELFANEEKRKNYRAEGVGYAFLKKHQSYALQAADLLAWQWAKDRKNQTEGRPQRKDFANLAQLHNNFVHLDRASLVTLATSTPEQWQAFLGSPVANLALQTFRKIG